MRYTLHTPDRGQRRPSVDLFMFGDAQIAVNKLFDALLWSGAESCM